MSPKFPILPIVEHYSHHPIAVNGRGWSPVRCPWHDDHNASASINEELGAFNCHSCGVKGDAIKLVRMEEGLDYRAAVERCAELTGESDHEISEPTVGRRRSPILRVSSGEGPDGGHRTKVQARKRRRPRRL